LGIVKDSKLNPLVTLAKAPTLASVERGYETENPSCGLAEAIQYCLDGKSTNANVKQPSKSWFFETSFCSDLSGRGIVIYESGYTYERFLIVYRKVKTVGC
jgi:hypothetical protein